LRAKPEARILVTKCYNNACLGIIMRGLDVDGAVSGRNCGELCEDLEKRGYMGELRFAAGDCRCGLPLPPQCDCANELLVLASRLPLIVERFEKLGAKI
jgi:hypothetical protein